MGLLGLLWLVACLGLVGFLGCLGDLSCLGGLGLLGVGAARGGRHQEPPDVAWLPPELEIGVEPELNPLELELELELEFELEFELELEPVELEPLELDPVELEPVELEPEEVEPEDEPELAELPVDEEPDDVEEEAVLCVEPGRASATMPAAATLAIVTVVVAERTLIRPRSRSAMARRTRSRCALLMYPILRSHTRNSPARTFSVRYEADGLSPSSRADATHAT